MTKVRSGPSITSFPIHRHESITASGTDHTVKQAEKGENSTSAPNKLNELSCQGKAVQQALLKKLHKPRAPTLPSPSLGKSIAQKVKTAFLNAANEDGIASKGLHLVQSKRPPWIPLGITSTTSTRATPENSRFIAQQSKTHSYVAQAGFESCEWRSHRTGSIETTLYNAKSLPGQYTSLSVSEGKPELVRPKTKSGRLYVSLDSPAMGNGVLDLRLNRAQVGQLYRVQYRLQQIKKNQADFIPVTYHAEVSLPVIKIISDNLVPQFGWALKTALNGKTSLLKKLDQVSDYEKYRHSAGILPASFDAIKQATKPGTERLATGIRRHRRELGQTFNPSTIVHPSELRTRSEQMEARNSIRKARSEQDRAAINPQFLDKAPNRSSDPERGPSASKSSPVRTLLLPAERTNK